MSYRIFSWWRYGWLPSHPPCLRLGAQTWKASCDVLSPGTRPPHGRPQRPSPGRRRTKRESVHYRMVDGTLLGRESDGVYAVCVTRREVPAALRWAHDHYGHFGTAATMHKLRGVLWWPTRYAELGLSNLQVVVMSIEYSEKQPTYSVKAR